MTARQRLTAFAVIVVAALALGAASLALAIWRPSTGAAGTIASAPRALPPADRPFVLFRSTAPGPDYGALAFVNGDASGPMRAVPDLRCRRVHMAAGRGVCLAAVHGTSFVARIFDRRFGVRAELPLLGVPSRVQVSPDGSLAAITVFVSGHSYADINLSTRTSIVDLAAGTWLVEDVETFTVHRDGAGIDSPDFNFWGVTFLRDSRSFYATLATKGQTFLVRGNVDRRTVDVVAADVECPSISPDNLTIAFKQRVVGEGRVVRWEVWLLDIASGKRRALGERQSIDDQVQWIDDARIIYARATDGDPASTDLWVLDRDGTSPPRMFLPRASSGVLVVPPAT